MMPQRRRLFEGYGSELLGDQPSRRPPNMMAQPNPAANIAMPVEMAGGEQPMDPNAALNPLNTDAYLGLKKRRLGMGMGGML